MRAVATKLLRKCWMSWSSSCAFRCRVLVLERAASSFFCISRRLLPLLEVVLARRGCGAGSFAAVSEFVCNIKSRRKIRENFPKTQSPLNLFCRNVFCLADVEQAFTGHFFWFADTHKFEQCRGDVAEPPVVQSCYICWRIY